MFPSTFLEAFGFPIIKFPTTSALYNIDDVGAVTNKETSIVERNFISSAESKTPACSVVLTTKTIEYSWYFHVDFVNCLWPAVDKLTFCCCLVYMCAELSLGK